MTREQLTEIERKLGWSGSDTWPVPKHVILWATAVEKLLKEKEQWAEQSTRNAVRFTDWREMAQKFYTAAAGDLSRDEWNALYAEYDALIRKDV